MASLTTLHWIHYATNLNGWVMPRNIIEPEIICENENDMGLSVVLGSPLLLGEAGAVAEERHQEGDQHSSSQLILLNKKMLFIFDRTISLGIYSLCMSNLGNFTEIKGKEFNYCPVRHGLL